MVGYSFIRTRQPFPIHKAGRLLLERQGEEAGSGYHTWPAATVMVAYSFIRSRQPFPIHTAGLLLLERQGGACQQRLPYLVGGEGDGGLAQITRRVLGVGRVPVPMIPLRNRI